MIVCWNLVPTKMKVSPSKRKSSRLFSSMKKVESKQWMRSLVPFMILAVFVTYVAFTRLYLGSTTDSILEMQSDRGHQRNVASNSDSKVADPVNSDISSAGYDHWSPDDVTVEEDDFIVEKRPFFVLTNGMHGSTYLMVR